jgi:hypothetical protein
MSLFKRLKSLFGIPIDSPVAWTESERRNFLLFAQSSTGIKFIEFLRQYASQITFNAVRGSMGGKDCAYARGVQDAVLLIVNLTNVPEGNGESPEGILNGFDENLEPLPSQEWQKKRRGPLGGHSAI